MTILITIIHVIVCLFLIAVVLLQSGKSGDLAAAFGGQGSQTAFGPRGAASALSRATTWSAISSPKAENPDEIAGVLAHELGHLNHRDNMRALIYNGGTSFLIGLLFGDVTGSSAVIFASRSLVTASYSRKAEQDADTFSIGVMHRLGRSPKPMGELLFRVTGKQGDDALSILASHPLTEDRLKRMSDEDRPPSGPPLLTAEEWTSLKAICSSGN